MDNHTEIAQTIKKMRKLLKEQQVPGPYYIYFAIYSEEYWYARQKGWAEIVDGLFLVPNKIPNE